MLKVGRGGAVAVVFRALGEVGIEVDGDALRLRPQERALLALLMCDTNRPVPADLLMHQLWRGQPPASGRTALRVHIDRIRSTMRHHDLSRLVSVDHAYRLVVEPGEFDADEVARSVRWARSAAHTQPALAASRLRAALGLWRGQPFRGIDDIEPIDTARRAYESSWVDLVTLLAEVELLLGRHRELRSELLGWSEALPYSEDLAAAAAVAHYRCGDHVQALALVRDFTRRLDDELGLEPTARLRRLETDILNHATALTPPLPRLDDPRPGTDSRGRLPGFQREADLLASVVSDPPAGRGCVVVTGARGSGRSTLLVHFSARDDALALTASDAGGSAVARLEGVLGVAPWSPSATPGTGLPHSRRAFEIARACTRKQIGLLVVDDVAAHNPDDIAVLRALLELEAPRPTLLTSARGLRRQLHPLLTDAGTVADSWSLDLEPRDRAQCRELLTEVLPGLTALGERELDSLAQRSGGNPALLVALARDAAYGHCADDVPATVGEYVTRLLDHLTPVQRELAYLASIDVAPTLDLTTLATALGSDDATSVDAVESAEALVGEGLLVDAGHGLAYRIHLVRDVVAGSRSTPRRQSAHALLARTLIEAGSGDISRIGHHLRSADLLELTDVTASFTAQEARLLAAGGDALTARSRFRYAAELAQRHTGELVAGLGWELDACGCDVQLGQILVAQARAAGVASRARSTGQAAVFARAAILATGPWRPTGREQLIAAALTEEALELTMPAADSQDRTDLLEACIRAHLGVQSAAFDAMARPLRLELEAAAASGPPHQRAVALRGLHSLSWRDGGTATTRSALSAQLVLCCDLSGDRDLHLEALRIHATDLLVEARAREVGRALDDYCRAASAARSPLHLWWSATLARTAASLRGDTEAADAASAVAELEAPHIDDDLLAVAALERAFADALSLGDPTRVVPMLSGDPARDVTDDPVVAGALLIVRLASGVDVTPREVEDAWTGTVGTPREAPGAAFAALALVDLPVSGERDRVAHRVLASLLTHAGSLVTINGAAHFGPIDGYAAMVCAMLGQPDDATLRSAASSRLLESFTQRPPTSVKEPSWQS